MPTFAFVPAALSFALAAATVAQDPPTESTAIEPAAANDLGAALAKAKSDWTIERALLAQRVAELQQQIATASEQLSPTQCRTKLLARQAQLQRATAAVEQAMIPFERRARALLSRTPARVQQHLTPLTSRLQADSAKVTSTNQRGMVLIGILHELNKYAVKLAPPAADGDDANADPATALEPTRARLAALRQANQAERQWLLARITQLETERSQLRELLTDPRDDGAIPVDLIPLQRNTAAREEQRTYLANLLHEYTQKALDLWPPADPARHDPRLELAIRAGDCAQLLPTAVLAKQVIAIELSIDRLERVLGESKPR